MKIQVGDIPMNVVDEGSGEAILFVHGFPLDHAMWRFQIEEFSKTHRVIAPDLRGFGESETRSETASLEQYADDLANLLDGIGLV